MRDFIGDKISIDGRMICYRLETGLDYLLAKGYSQKKAEKLYEGKIGSLITQIMALKQSCFLLRRTSHSCQSLPDGLYDLKLRLIQELKEKHNFEFDDAFVESDEYCGKEGTGNSYSDQMNAFREAAARWKK
jgi:hypothetical protein